MLFLTIERVPDPLYESVGRTPSLRVEFGASTIVAIEVSDFLTVLTENPQLARYDQGLIVVAQPNVRVDVVSSNDRANENKLRTTFKELRIA